MWLQFFKKFKFHCFNHSVSSVSLKLFQIQVNLCMRINFAHKLSDSFKINYPDHKKCKQENCHLKDVSYFLS